MIEKKLQEKHGEFLWNHETNIGKYSGIVRWLRILEFFQQFSNDETNIYRFCTRHYHFCLFLSWQPKGKRAAGYKFSAKLNSIRQLYQSHAIEKQKFPSSGWLCVCVCIGDIDVTVRPKWQMHMPTFECFQEYSMKLSSEYSGSSTLQQNMFFLVRKYIPTLFIKSMSY